MHNGIRKMVLIFGLGTAMVMGMFSCSKKEKVDTSPSLTLSFSSDTIFFDTVFTTVGSVTQRLVVYNNNDNKVKVSSIALAGGSQSFYKLNIDGTATSSENNVEIPGHDSLYIFIRITIDPNNQSNPLVVADSIVFVTNGNIQDVNLLAWGQDAWFHKNEILNGNVLWDSLKPHVVYGSLRVDTSGTLTMLQGTKVYFHKDAYLAVSNQASLKVNGTMDHQVRFQGDRLDPYYRHFPGTWKGILLEQGSIRNEIDYAIIKNGTYGLAVDSLGSSADPVLTVNNTIIRNMTNTGIIGYATHIVSANCVIGNCGTSALDLSFGGSYDFRQLTIGNYWSGSVRLSPSIYLSDYTYGDMGEKIQNPMIQAYFGNCIVYGTEENEITIDPTYEGQMNFTFDHGLLKTEDDITDSPHYISCIANEDPMFVDPGAFNYNIDSLSPAIGKGIPMGVSYDILGVERGPNPDLGAYQWVPSR